jgi:hypothetical protein
MTSSTASDQILRSREKLQITMKFLMIFMILEGHTTAFLPLVLPFLLHRLPVTLPLMPRRLSLLKVHSLLNRTRRFTLFLYLLLFG